MRALVIDDSKAMRAIISAMLKEIGFEVTEAKNGLEAIERLRETGPLEVALVDWNMPEMNGYEFVRSVRAQNVYDRMRLMMVTTETEMTQVEKALEAGANEYVMKPFTREVILEKLEILGMDLPCLENQGDTFE
jgi:two-component system chemotaxis response regulator CheY